MLIREVVNEENIELLALTETWLHEGDDNAINELCCDDLKFVGAHRPTSKGTRGGGIGFIMRKEIEVKTIQHSFNTFEAMTLIIGARYKVAITLLYRPPPTRNNGYTVAEFQMEAETLMSDLCSGSEDDVYIIGDFNIHYGKADDHSFISFDQTLQSLGLVQLVRQPTHKSGNILDLVITRSKDSIQALEIHDPDISDHSLITLQMLLAPTLMICQQIRVRPLKNLNVPVFQEDIQKEISVLDPTSTLTEMVDWYNRTTRDILNQHAPMKTITPKGDNCKNWYDDNIHEERKKRRKLERKFKKSGLEVERQMLQEQSERVVRLIKQKKTHFYNQKFRDANCKETFRLLNSLLTADRSRPLPSGFQDKDLAEKFSSFFVGKVRDIRSELDALQNNIALSDISDHPEPCMSHLPQFSSVSERDIRELIRQSAPKSCSLDPMPTSLLRNEDLLQTLLPVVTRMINESLTTGVVPADFKESHVVPRLKKPGLDPDVMKHFRPVSNLPFIGKILEKVAVKQLNSYLLENDLHDPFQSAYKQKHSTETALLKVTTDIAQMMDDGDAALLVLLDLSAAFDTIDHHILLNRLQQDFGICNTALAWMCSYLADRKQSVLINESTSSPRNLSVGVPQGSVMGPILFLLYIAPLARLIDRHGILRHGYADDTQLYCRLPMRNATEITAAILRMNACISDVRCWMIRNKLKINDGKTEALLIGTKKSHLILAPMNISVRVGDMDIHPSTTARNLGAIFETDLSFNKHVSHLVKTSYFHLRRIRQIRSFLTKDSCKKAIHACVTSRLDFNNSLLIYCTESNKNRIQVAQNNAARIITGTRGRDHITPVLMDLRWLPVQDRINFKILSIVHKAIYDVNAPVYMKDFIEFYQPSRHLRSSSDILRLTPHNFNTVLLRKSFIVYYFKLWNTLPLFIRQINCHDSFKAALKTFLFKQFY